ncbi:MAG TPA: hypothetical protein VEB59_06595 [Gemmatimonadales bacterium]|nr:hypothetical protein [Gemmatimonadales bacterium]
MHESPREVRLRSEFAGLYPGLNPGIWVPATQWAAAIVTMAHEARHDHLYRRTFDPRHFEFRGGPGPRGPGEGHLRTRAEDR